jgi:hypothetical protein
MVRTIQRRGSLPLNALRFLLRVEGCNHSTASNSQNIGCLLGQPPGEDLSGEEVSKLRVGPAAFLEEQARTALQGLMASKVWSQHIHVVHVAYDEGLNHNLPGKVHHSDTFVGPN